MALSTGDVLKWYVRDALPDYARAMADVISLLTLPYESTYPSVWFDGQLANSRFLELPTEPSGEEDDEEDNEDEYMSPQEMAIALSVGIVKGVIDSASGDERDGLQGLEEWLVENKKEEPAPVIASASEIEKAGAMEHRLISVDGVAVDDEDEGVEVSVAAWLIGTINSSKLKVIITRLRSLCSRRKRGPAIFLNEEQLARAEARRAASARHAARGPSHKPQLLAQVKELQASLADERALALRMAKALLTAEAIGRKAALALTAAKARDLHKELFSDSTVTEHRLQVNDIAEAMVPDAAFEEAKAICAVAAVEPAAEAEAAAEAEE